MRVGAIDIGTNTILLLIADVRSDGSLVVVQDVHAIARLGKGIDANRVMQPETFQRAVEFLQRYRSIIDAEQVDTLAVTATSFLRDTQNKNEFIAHIKKQVGLEIRVLSGAEEGDLTYRGAISEFLKPNEDQEFAVLDIGGGSTECTAGKNNEVLHRTSIDIGSVRLTERFLKISPPAPNSFKEARQYIRQQLKSFSHPTKTTKLIGVAGTLTTLAAIDLNLQQYDRTVVSGHVLKCATINSIFQELSRKTLDELKVHPQILPARADILLAGILILLETLDVLGLNEITVSDRGLRFGLAMEAANNKLRNL